MGEEESPAPVVLLVDDQELLVSSLEYVFRENGFDAHRLPVTDLATMRAAAAGFRPGVALLDLGLGADGSRRPLDGADFVGPLRELGWTVLVVTGTTELERVAAAVARGAANWMLKTADFAELVRVTSELFHGRGRLPEQERATLLARHGTRVTRRETTLARLGTLSAREREVLERLTDGASAATIARESYTSVGTVRTHIRAILSKLEVSSQLAAVALLARYRD